MPLLGQGSGHGPDHLLLALSAGSAQGADDGVEQFDVPVGGILAAVGRPGRFAVCAPVAEAGSDAS